MLMVIWCHLMKISCDPTTTPTTTPKWNKQKIVKTIAQNSLLNRLQIAFFDLFSKMMLHCRLGISANYNGRMNNATATTFQSFSKKLTFNCALCIEVPLFCLNNAMHFVTIGKFVYIYCNSTSIFILVYRPTHLFAFHFSSTK